MQVISRPMQETESWPLCGSICCLQGTVGDSRAKAGQGHSEEPHAMLRSGLKTTGPSEGSSAGVGRDLRGAGEKRLWPQQGTVGWTLWQLSEGQGGCEQRALGGTAPVGGRDTRNSVSRGALRFILIRLS